MGEPNRHMLHSDLYTALKLALSEELCIIKNGKLARVVNTKSEMNDLASRCYVRSDKEMSPRFRAQKACVDTPKLAQDNIRRVFWNILSDELREQTALKETA